MAEMFAARQAEKEAAQLAENAALNKGEAFSNPPKIEGDTTISTTSVPGEQEEFRNLGSLEKPSDLQNSVELPKESAPSGEQLSMDIPDSSRTPLWDMIKNNPKASTALGVGALGAGAYALSGHDENPIPLKTKAQMVSPEEKKVETPEAVVAPKAMEKATEVAASKPEEESSEDETVEEKTEEVKAPGRTLDFGTGSVSSMENLQAVQDKANNIRMMSGIMQGVEQIGSGLSAIGSGGRSQTKVDSKDFFANMNKQADQLMVDYKAKIDMEKKDPNSSYTQGLKDFIKKTYGYEIKGDISGADLEGSVMKPLEKQWEQQLLDKRQRELKAMQLEQLKEQGLQRKATTDLAREAQQQRHEENMGLRKDIVGQREFASLKTNLQKAGGTAGNAIRNRIVASDAIFATVGQDHNITEKEIQAIPSSELNKLSRVLVTELGLETNRMLTAGTPAQSTLDKLIPKNIQMDATKLQDYVTNKLNPAQQAEFVRAMLKVAARVRKTSSEQNTALVKQLVAGTKHLYDRAPDQYEALMTEHGISPEDLDTLLARKDKVLPQARKKELEDIMANKPLESKIQKKIVKKGYNASTNQTQLIYDDGTKEIVEGRK